MVFVMMKIILCKAIERLLMHGSWKILFHVNLMETRADFELVTETR